MDLPPYRPPAERFDTPTITVGSTGTLGFNEAAVQALDSPPAVRLDFDVDRRVVAIFPCWDGGPGTRRLHPRNRNITAKTFLRETGMATAAGAVRYHAKLVDGALRVDLNAPGISFTGNRARY